MAADSKGGDVSDAERGAVTALLRRLSSERHDRRREVYDELFALVYAELKRISSRQLKGERDPALHPTTLVHQAYERLLPYRMDFTDRQHFFRVAAAAMRRILVDKARRRRALRRGSGQAPKTLDATLDQAVAASTAAPDLVLDVDRAMSTLTPAQAALVDLRFFVGMTVEETADVMGVQVETLKKRWKVVRMLLDDELNGWRAR
jgi:RNA polymerase sigma factor (TIGR02999 family)